MCAGDDASCSLEPISSIPGHRAVRQRFRRRGTLFFASAFISKWLNEVPGPSDSAFFLWLRSGPGARGWPPRSRSEQVRSHPFRSDGDLQRFRQRRALSRSLLSSANINNCATNAAKQAKAAGLALYFPAGIYFLSAWAPPCPLVIIGGGKGQTILQRPASSAGSVVASTGCGGLQISNLTIDGNKANNSTTGYTVVLSGNWNVTLNDWRSRTPKALEVH